MATVILLIRHAAHGLLGRTLCGRMPDVHLDEAGQLQAAALARRLRRRTLAAVYSSPLARAQETALPIALEQGLKMVLREDLNEIDFGDWSGRSFASLQCDPRWQRWNAQRATERPPNGEMIGEVQERAFACISRMAQDHPDAEVAAVSHGDVIKAVIAAVLGLPIEAHARFEISPASVSKIELWPDGCRLFCMNGVNEA